MIDIEQTINSRYVIKKRLGRGSFGQVFLAHDVAFERDVAIKVIPSQESDDPEQFLQTFLQEAKVVARLSHPNILDVYDYGQVRDEAFLVMPFANGGTLADKLRRMPRLSADQATDFGTQIAKGLAYAHQADIIHRDLKPQNILVFTSRTGEDRLVIADFGLARTLASTGMHSTRAAGTPYYMAPEQWERHAGKPTDVYALGIMVYQMVAGAPPYEAETPAQLYVQHLKGTLPPLATKRPELPPAFGQLIEQMCAKDPAERPLARDLPNLFQKALTSRETLPRDWAKPPKVDWNMTTMVSDPPGLSQGAETMVSDRSLSPSPLEVSPVEPLPKNRPVWPWLLGGVVLTVLVMAVIGGIIFLLSANTQSVEVTRNSPASSTTPGTTSPTKPNPSPGTATPVSTTTAISQTVELPPPVSPLPTAKPGTPIGTKVSSFKTTDTAFKLYASPSENNLLGILSKGITTSDMSFWNVETGQRLTGFEEADKPQPGEDFAGLYIPRRNSNRYLVRSAPYHPVGYDDTKLVISPLNGASTYRILDTQTGRYVVTVEDAYVANSFNSESYYFFGPEKTWVAFTKTGGNIVFYDLQNGGKQLGMLDTGGNNKQLVKISNDDRYILVQDDYKNGRYFLYDISNLSTGKPLPNRTPVDYADWMDFNPKADRVIKLEQALDYSQPATFTLRALPKNEYIKRLVLPLPKDELPGWINDEQLIYTNSKDETIVLSPFRPAVPAEGEVVAAKGSIYEFRAGNDTSKYGIANFDNKTYFIMFDTKERLFQVYDVAAKSVIAEFKALGGVDVYKAERSIVVIDQDLASSGSFQLKVFDLLTGKQLAIITDNLPESRVVETVPSNNTKYLTTNFARVLEKQGQLAVVQNDGTLILYNLKSK